MRSALQSVQLPKGPLTPCLPPRPTPLVVIPKVLMAKIPEVFCLRVPRLDLSEKL